MRQSDQRRQPRFTPPRARIAGGAEPLELCNVSRSGMAVRSPGVDAWSRGETRHFTLEDGRDSVVLKGQVCWIAPTRTEDTSSGKMESSSTAGIAIIEVLSPQPRGIWQSLVAQKPPRPLKVEQPVIAGETAADEPATDRASRGNEPAIEKAPAVDEPALIKMTAPTDGEVVFSRLVTVEGILEDPSQVCSLTVNGFEASVAGNRFSSTIRIKNGVNSISAILHERGGAYRSVGLGRVELDTSREATAKWLFG